jgi:hypothetical protein
MKNLFLVSIFMFLSSCASFPKDDIKISAESDSKFNLKSYKAFTWHDSIGIINDPEGKWKPKDLDVDAELTAFITRELTERNIKESRTYADVIVSYQLGINMVALKKQVDSDSKMAVLKNIPHGALVITLVDSQTGFVVWAALATAEIHKLSPEQSKNRLDYVVTEMFKKLSPE